MEGQMIEINGKLYQFKFGLKALIELQKISNINIDDYLDLILYFGFTNSFSKITLNEIQNLDKSFKYSLCDKFNISRILNFLPSKQKVEEWYIQGVGEMNMPLETFYNLTPYEFDLAYKGYLRKMELAANLNQLANLRANNNNNELIKIIEDEEYSQGTIEERKEVFLSLGIQEDINGV